MTFVQVVWGALLSLALCASLAVQAAPLYQVTVVGGAGSAAYGINRTGQIVGQLAAGTERHAFYFDGATLTDLGTLGGANSIAWDLNDSGTVVGSASLATGGSRGFTYAGGVLTALPEGLIDARGINNGGAIVGIGRFPDGQGFTEPRAITYTGGVVTNLGLLPGTEGEGSYGYGINDAGDAVGEVEIFGAPNRPTQPFLYSNGVMQDLGNLGGIFSGAYAINDNNQVVGTAGGAYQNDGNLYPSKAFIWEAGVMRALGELIPNGDSGAFAINNAGQIVGRAQTAAGIRGFLYLGAGMVELDALIDPASGWTITAANAINDLQQIAGTACNLAGCYAVRLDLAAAIPEPGHLLMLAAGLLVLAGRFVVRHALALRRMPNLRAGVRARTVALSGALLCMAIGLPQAAQAALAEPLYKVTVVGSAGSMAYDLNNAGQVVGRLAAGAGGTGYHAFLFDGTQLTDLGTLGGANSIAWAINDSGTVVGSADTADAFRSFTYNGGTLTALPENLWGARDINQAGAITGSGGVEGYFSNAYIYANGVVTYLGGLPSTDEEGSFGNGINNAGKVVGEAIVGGAPNRPTQPFLYSDGVMQDLGNFGGIFSDARAINDHDQVVGAAGGPYLNDGNLYPAKAFLWEDGVMRMLGEFSPNGNSFANDINNLGQIVGTARSTQADLAFLYQGDSMVPLDALIDPASGWTITDANGINELQQIAATACKLGVCYAVRLDPTAAIPEPAHWLMLGAGLLVLLSGVPTVPAAVREPGRRAWQLMTLS